MRHAIGFVKEKVGYFQSRNGLRCAVISPPPFPSRWNGRFSRTGLLPLRAGHMIKPLQSLSVERTHIPDRAQTFQSKLGRIPIEATTRAVNCNMVFLRAMIRLPTPLNLQTSTLPIEITS